MYKLAIRLFATKAILLMGGMALVALSAGAARRTRPCADSIALAVMRSEAYTRAAHKRILSRNPHPEMCLQSSDICNVSDKECFYVYEDQAAQRGFVIVSADDNMPEVLAFSPDATFSKDSLPPPVRLLLESYMWKESGGQPTERSFSRDASTSATDEVGPLLGELPWGQGTPFNQQCPYYSGRQCVTGCVATAMAQVMWLHKWPEQGHGKIDYTTRTSSLHIQMDLGAQPFEWRLMKEAYRTGDYTSKEADAVAALMAYCGASVRMDYGIEASGAYQADILPSLVRYFGYDPDAAFLPRDYFSTQEWNELLLNELNEGRAINYAGVSRSEGGHSFVIDGYRFLETASEPYYHLNWGWQGQCNGYYLLPRLNPGENGTEYFEEGFNEG